MTQPIATVSASMPRRLFGLTALFFLGALLVYIAFARPPQVLGWQVFLIVFGLVVLAIAEVMRRSTAGKIVLTEEGLFDSDGRVLAPIDEISGVERGVFAMKPSNGFVVRTSTARGRAWAPGLYWRLGRRLGVGGVTAAHQTKFMAEQLTVMLAARGTS